MSDEMSLFSADELMPCPLHDEFDYTKTLDYKIKNSAGWNDLRPTLQIMRAIKMAKDEWGDEWIIKGVQEWRELRKRGFYGG